MRPFRDAGGSLIDLFIFLLYISFFALLFYLLFAGLVLAKVVIGDTGGGGGGGYAVRLHEEFAGSYLNFFAFVFIVIFNLMFFVFLEYCVYMLGV